MEQGTKRMLTVNDIMERLSVSKSSAYTVMKEINSELSEMGLRTIPGRVSETHFNAIYFGCDESRQR